MERTVKTKPRCSSCGHELQFIEVLQVNDRTEDVAYFCGTVGCKVLKIELRFPLGKYQHPMAEPEGPFEVVEALEQRFFVPRN